MKWPGRSRGSWDRSSTTSPTPWSTPSPGARTRFMASLRVEVVYALPLDEDAGTLSLAAGAAGGGAGRAAGGGLLGGGGDAPPPPRRAGGTGGEAVRASGVLQRHPEIDLRHQRIGIHGRVVTAGTLLRDVGGVEVYPPLTVDPKEARGRRAFKKT